MRSFDEHEMNAVRRTGYERIQITISGCWGPGGAAVWPRFVDASGFKAPWRCRTDAVRTRIEIASPAEDQEYVLTNKAKLGSSEISKVPSPCATAFTDVDGGGNGGGGGSG